MGGVTLVVLLIACANVANLLLARATRRRREMAVRRAIGGSRRRLIQQLLTETVVLAALGSVAGLAAAAVSSGTFRRVLATTSDAWPVVSDRRTLFFAIGLTLFAALCSGIVPALAAGTDDLAGSLKAGMRDAAYRHSRLRKTLLVFQTALSVVLLVGAGLFIRSLQHVRDLPLGYDVDHVVYVEASMRGANLKPVEQTLLAQRLRSAAGETPGVVSSSQIVSVPFYSGESRGLRVEGVDSIRKLGRFQLQSGSPEYFKTTGTRVVRGRAFDAQDRENTARVVVVSESMGKVLWKDADPIGKCIRVGDATAPCTTVIGIAEDTRARNIIGSGEFMYYVPIAQYVSSFGGLPMLAMFVRVSGTSDDRAEAIRSRLQRVMPGPAYVTARPFHEIIDPTMRSWTSGARMFATFGALALLLAAVGLYAAVGFTVSQRTQELGVRIALGALPRDVLHLVVGEGLRVTLLGVAIGALVAFAGARAVDKLLYGVSPRDPMIYGIVALVLLAVGMLASAVPASRAARVDPNTALRAE